MFAFLINRLLGLLLTMVVASFLVFAVMEFTPGHVAKKMLGPYVTAEQVQILYDKLNLGDPLPVRYVRWVGVLVGAVEDPLGKPELNLGFKDPRGHQYFGNFGFSTLYKVPVNDIMWERLGNTAVLAGIAFAIIVPLSILFGVLSGMRAGSAMDRTLSMTGIVLTSIPEFALAVFGVVIFVVGFGLLPGTSPLDTRVGWSIASQLFLPVLVLVLYDFGYVARMVRGSVIDVMAKPYVRTAVLKGLPQRRVILVHVLRNAMIAPFTVILLQIPFLISGVVVTEVVFAYPGFGRMLLEASLYGDITTVEAATLVAVLIAVCTQMVGDIGYMYLNPRIRFG
jgi:peptide/nickel transport system permease protein